jgi:DNA-binding LacI/PurR family transcriptional regulator
VSRDGGQLWRHAAGTSRPSSKVTGRPRPVTWRARELAADPEVTAVFVSGDDMAIGLIHALTEAGRRVPHDVSVIGFDGNPVFAYVTPPLTTVRQPFDAAARDGLRLLVHAIEKPDTEVPPASDPPVELVVRGSTAPPPPQG